MNCSIFAQQQFATSNNLAGVFSTSQQNDSNPPFENNTRLDQNHQDMISMQKLVTKIEYKLDNLNKRVDKLSELTLFHAPSWAHHVSEPLLDQSDNDWRLLAVKLQYSVDEIQNFASKADPCLVMLNDWFAEKNSEQATNILCEILKDIKRLDAAKVVKTAISSINGVKTSCVDDRTYEKPEIYLSYQWSKQAEIKELYKKLKGIGYNCWLDIMEMGGGDSLYEKIDSGIRRSKVILNCVTRKYALSKNCKREVSLSDSLERPIIPLLLEDMKWPPKGP
ncbi:unnamed protein product [Dimorphilus gyrociliatus]|uniref:Uncharacterized protein n=1 Tax=Dimorphilus gyrociliatus TaxID=2664684 RepID=A0A7I8WFL1_9ANNE|nr:unnamed protein product [Dimorphilus gyrociliatus]